MDGLFLHQALPDVNLQDRSGDTNLILASKYGHTSIVDLLLRRHADLDTRGKESKTALYNAVEKNHTEVARLLSGWRRS